jgi:branched-chain amino acid transport system permease protein
VRTTEAPSAARPLAVPAPAAARTLGGYGIWLAAAAVLIVLPWVVRAGAAVPIMNQMGIAIVFALSFNMLMGQGGMLSFGHAVYFGLGGFIAAHALNMAGRGGLYLPVPLLPLVGGLGGLVFAALFGTFSTSRAGTVFSMVSLAVAELMAASSLIFDRFFGGEEGITTNRAKAPLLFGLEFTRDRQVYYLIGFWVLVSAVAMYAFSRTPIGRMANAVRDNPERAEFVGYSQRRVRLVSFCAAGFFAGIAGGLFAINYEILTAENMGLNASGAVLLMTYIGGVGSFVGPIFGAIIFTFLQSMLSDYTGLWLLYVGILFLATVLWAPVGLAGILMLHAPAWRARRIGRLVGPYVIAGVVGLVAAVGVIGLLEMLHAVLVAEGPVGTKRLFWTTVNVRGAGAWLIFAALVLAGALGLRWAGPRAAAAFTEANRPGPAR